MYFRELWASCRRRWYLLVALLLVSAGLSFGAAQAIGPEYEVKASVVLIPPTSPEEPNANRLLGLGNLTFAVDVLARSMTSGETSEAIGAEAPNAKYEVLSDPTTSAPILQVTVTSPDKKAAGVMLNAVLQTLPANLDALQDDLGIKSRNRIDAKVVSEDLEPVANQKSRVRALGVIGVGLLFGSMVLVGAVDGLMLRRKARRDGTTGSGQPDDWTPPEPDPEPSAEAYPDPELESKPAPTPVYADHPAAAHEEADVEDTHSAEAGRFEVDRDYEPAD